MCFKRLEALKPFFWLNTFFFNPMFLKSTLLIFNVSGLGQSSDLFLLLFFPSLTIVEISMSCSACCILRHVCASFFPSFFDHCRILHHSFGARLYKKDEGVLYNFDLISFIPMVFLQFLAGHLVKLRWRLSTLHQLKWSGARRCPPSSTVRSEDTRCTMSRWLMGSPQDSQSSRTSWLMMPRYSTPHPNPSASRLISQTNSPTLDILTFTQTAISHFLGNLYKWQIIYT